MIDGRILAFFGCRSSRPFSAVSERGLNVSDWLDGSAVPLHKKYENTTGLKETSVQSSFVFECEPYQTKPDQAAALGAYHCQCGYKMPATFWG
jgi:hypothetical protein